MEKIQNQISLKITEIFAGCTSFDDLENALSAADNYITDGVNRMRDIHVFSTREIDAIKGFAIDCKFQHYRAKNTDIKEQLRDSFIF